MSKKISASVVTYNNGEEIENVLLSLQNSSIIDQLEVYVMDNNSNDNTKKIVENKFPKVKLIKSNENVGFGAGHNQVISIVDSTYHLLVNPDITFEPSVIEGLSKYMDENPDVVIVSPKILNHDGTEQYLPKLNPKIRYFLGGRFEKYGGIFKKWRSEYTRSNETFTGPEDIEFCTGCFMFIRTSNLKQVGGFDERYFLHFEDADLARMMKQKGRVVFNPDYEVNHLWKRDNVKSRKVFIIALHSMFKYFRKWGIR
ncbi:glycosyltransferase family 2 protein [Clostridium estertheticum]|uniref:glycosyltransferase family 2 protein n=1 Tax=Clostridium estertheticum TaxID=238834 RepID=UPI001CF1A2C0|nr:glycosyltransferase family 2 protein [Clostridium estertheticum]MCB2306044.1 glycosyltransferase family 2 protein [Clostridium estertheticum]MCB2346567.1 glycosyltransferase family 2 protein [Clostridium estertheticum]MCB2348985.1 glycosyltransferase family 2 protein [Clostridium estertheticum]WAG47626.1 glycosyltransferase family 2 protein [Clostridium estertheticum]